MRRATVPWMTTGSRDTISIHALLAESDRPSSKTGRRFRYFYPRSPCGERPYVFAAGNKAGAISIHALLAESDMPGLTPAPSPIISIHALLAESDTTTATHTTAATKFLSTLSLRRATCDLHPLGDGLNNFYPRSPCGERLFIFIGGAQNGC